MLLAFGPMVMLASAGSSTANRVQTIGDELSHGRAAPGILEDDVDERVPHVRGPRIARMSGDPASALITGSVTSVSITWGLRGHFDVDDDLRIGDVGDGVERRRSERVDAERRSAAPTSGPHNPAEPDDALDDGGDHARPGELRAFQLVLGIDEETAEGDHLFAGFSPLRTCVYSSPCTPA